MKGSDEVAIVGIGETRVGRFPDRSALDLQCEAVLLALADAGLRVTDVDGLFNLGPYSQPTQMFALNVSEHLGIRPNLEATIDAGGIMSVMMMLANAMWAIESGDCEVVVCTFGENAATGRKRAGRGHTVVVEGDEFEERAWVYGGVTPYALLASHYLRRYGVTEEAFGEVAVATRRHASRNENAVMREPITLTDHAGSRLVSSPLRLLDCSVIVDGAGAVVVTRSDRARDLARRPVRLLGAAARSTHRNVNQFPGFEDVGIDTVGRRAFAAAGVTVADVDVATIHDAFTFAVLVYLEELGFCGRGEGGAYVAGGNIDRGARCPVNTHGGLLSQGHVGGFLHLTEAVRQLQGEAGDRQVEGAEVALVAGGGGIFGVNAAMVLGAG